jgi:hypothetical protein
MTRRRGRQIVGSGLPPAMGHNERNTRLVIQARWREEEDAQLLAPSSTSDAPPRLCGNLHHQRRTSTARPHARTNATATKTDTTVVVSYPPALGNPLALRTLGTWEMMMRTLITSKHINKKIWRISYCSWQEIFFIIILFIYLFIFQVSAFASEATGAAEGYSH